MLVLPPINGGLHCGAHLASAAVASELVLPPINGGLHCGVSCAVRADPGVPVLPPINGGLHCGLQVRVGLLRFLRGAPAYQRRAPLRLALWYARAHSLIPCSRLSTAGSIAA